jgi:hypothetical protein
MGKPGRYDSPRTETLRRQRGGDMGRLRLRLGLETLNRFCAGLRSSPAFLMKRDD